ncbi:NAD-dependent epimerase/dehydratase family protein [Wenxinia marina]|uniref:Nucleoside-diphosphate-sugar epimerase n=1 Tax=Wenxinia marina DSM 24838 TaxID=1123501 RepID=A0A0D0QDJ6_9RHOB|nr:NAD(P)-dependent oxidoreductase [Wenxinia marina]KIQ70407.1 Nucleoside-diphosphate-sugar epimerase [Wenxinia marina DSM 24838]GGL53426.1 sulfolipid biosynthesis protein [Wenxinia marina]
MRVALTGATGSVGPAVLERLLADGHEVTALGRRPVAGAAFAEWDLAGRFCEEAAGRHPAASALARADALVHLALAHLPGRYRGGEGDDPEGFLRLNLGGTLDLFEAAADVPRIVLLSTRAVYGAYPPGTLLTEEMTPRPDTLYGQVKAAAEDALTRRPGGVSLRATGVYGPERPGTAHKWRPLLDAFGRGETVGPRVATEVHEADLAAAVALALTLPDPPPLLNVSDIVLDRRDLLSAYARIAHRDGLLPPPGDPATVSAMATDRIRAFGWRPRGIAGVEDVLRGMADGTRDHAGS